MTIKKSMLKRLYDRIASNYRRIPKVREKNRVHVLYEVCGAVQVGWSCKEMLGSKGSVLF